MVSIICDIRLDNVIFLLQHMKRKIKFPSPRGLLKGTLRHTMFRSCTIKANNHNNAQYQQKDEAVLIRKTRHCRAHNL